MADLPGDDSCDELSDERAGTRAKLHHTDQEDEQLPGMPMEQVEVPCRLAQLPTPALEAVAAGLTGRCRQQARLATMGTAADAADAHGLATLHRALRPATLQLSPERMASAQTAASRQPDAGTSALVLVRMGGPASPLFPEQLAALFGRPCAALTSLQLLQFQGPPMPVVRAAAAAASAGLAALTVDAEPRTTDAPAFASLTLDLAELAELCPGLRSLEAKNCLPPLCEGVRQLTSLTRLTLHQSSWRDCSGLAALTGLRALHVHGRSQGLSWDARLQPMLAGLTELATCWALPDADMPALRRLSLDVCGRGGLAQISHRAPGLTRLCVTVGMRLSMADIAAFLPSVRSLSCYGAELEGAWRAPAGVYLAVCFPRVQCLSFGMSSTLDLCRPWVARATALRRLDLGVRCREWQAQHWRALGALPRLEALALGQVGRPGGEPGDEEAFDACLALCARMSHLALGRAWSYAKQEDVWERVYAGLAGSSTLRTLHLLGGCPVVGPAAWASLTSLPRLEEAWLDGVYCSRAEASALAGMPSLVRLHFAGLEGPEKLPRSRDELDCVAQLERAHEGKGLLVTAGCVAADAGLAGDVPRGMRAWQQGFEGGWEK